MPLSVQAFGTKCYPSLIEGTEDKQVCFNVKWFYVTWLCTH